MPEAEAIVELITKDIVTSLSAVQRAGGWANDFTVRRPNPALGNARINGLVVVVMLDADRVDVEDEDNAFMYWRQSYSAVCHVREPEASSVVIDARMASMAAEVIKKLMEAPRRGEYAFDTVVTGIITNSEALHASAGEIAVSFDVVYRHAYADPFSK